MSAITVSLKDRRRYDRILGVVGDIFDVPPSMLRLHQRTAEIVYPRSIAWYLAYTMYNWSYARIGRVSGQFNHATVMNGLANIRRQLSRDPAAEQVIAEITERVKGAEAEFALVPKQRQTRLDVLEARVAALESLYMGKRGAAA